jgi:hypothetical protein
VSTWKEYTEIRVYAEMTQEQSNALRDVIIQTAEDIGIKLESLGSMRTSKRQGALCKCGSPLVGGYSCQRTDCNQNSKV